MRAIHPFQQRSLNPLDEDGNEGCARCGRPRDAHRAPVCGCPERDGMVYRQRGTCTDPVVARLDWYADVYGSAPGLRQAVEFLAGALNGVLASHPVAQLAPEMLATEALYRFAEEGQWLTGADDDEQVDARAELLAVRAAVREAFNGAARPAPGAVTPAQPRDDAARLRYGMRDLLDRVTASADATRPSRKTQTEDEVAAQLRQLLEES